MSCITCGIEIHKQTNGGLDYDPAECIHCERNRYRWFYEDEKEKRQTLQAEIERLRKVFMHCIETGVMTQDAYEIYDELKAKAEEGKG